jgi:23S rRNA (uracil1939-C5)-methyltransferase
LKALQVGNQVLLGFTAEMSHRIIDMHECHIMRPELYVLVDPLRRVLAGMVHPKRTAEVQLTLVDQGADVLLRGIPAGRLSEVEKLTEFAVEFDLARLSVDRGLGPDTVYAPQPPTVTLSRIPVFFPDGSFLQATEDGEDALIQAVREVAAGARAVADLFSGLGTFALATAAQYAAEASRDAAMALKRALPTVVVDHRDLYRRPLDRTELNRFDTVILDPPRAGAENQIAELARSSVRRIGYVSCNPATFARDAAKLIQGGYLLDWIEPVGQFRWSTHVELAACFTRHA